MNAWFFQHKAALASAFRRLWSTPLNTLLSLLVIGIALTLPAAGYLLLENLRELGNHATGVQQISLFMTPDASKKEVGEIEAKLRSVATGKWTFVPKEEALKRMQKNEGMADIVASLPRNPLPDAFIVEPTNTEPEALEIMRKEISSWPKVAHVQLDSAWVKRFDAFLKLGKLALWMLAGVFAAGLVLVTFNTIRLQVMAQAMEIEVARMIGATDAFIRRPFYYYGALQGGLGGLLAALVVAAGMALLAAPVSQLAALYGGSFTLRPLGAIEVIVLSSASAFLGWLGAQLSVSLSLRKFD